MIRFWLKEKQTESRAVGIQQLIRDETILFDGRKMEAILFNEWFLLNENK